MGADQHDLVGLRGAPDLRHGVGGIDRVSARGCWRCRPASVARFPIGEDADAASCTSRAAARRTAADTATVGDPLMVSRPNSFAPSPRMPSAPSWARRLGVFARNSTRSGDEVSDENAVAVESAVRVSAAVIGGPSEFHTKFGLRVMTHLPLTARGELARRTLPACGRPGRSRRRSQVRRSLAPTPTTLRTAAARAARAASARSAHAPTVCRIATIRSTHCPRRIRETCRPSTPWPAGLPATP